MQFNCIKMRYSVAPKDFLIVLKNEKKIKKAIEKKAEATGDLTGNKIADKITNISKKSSAEHSMAELHSKNDAKSETEVPKDTYLQKKGNKLLMNYDQYQKRMYISRNY